MPVSIGTTTNLPGIPYTAGCNCLFKSSSGKLILIADVNGDLKFKTSSDNGATWDGSWTEIDTEYASLAIFDAVKDTSDNIYLIWYQSGGAYLRKLTYNEGNWSVGDRKTVFTSASISRVTIVKRSSGELFASITYQSGTTYRLYGIFSSDDGDTWDSTNYVVLPDATRGLCSIEKSNTIWCFLVTYNIGKALCYEWDDVGKTWNSPVEIVSANVIGTDEDIGLLKISDSEIYTTIRLYSGAFDTKIYKWNGISWDSGTTLTTVDNRSPAIQNVAGNPIVVWRKYASSTYTIVYRKWNGISWDEEVELYNSSTNISRAVHTLVYDSSYLYVCWLTNPSPYTIYFDKVQLGASTEQETLTSDAIVLALGQEIITSDAEIDIPHSDILSDAHIFVIGDQKTITSLAKVVIGVIYDIPNKFNFVKQVLSDISNKVNTAIRVLSDVDNFINTCKLVLSNINNDVRTKKINLSNIVNDIRFLCSWQKAADGTFQSLGKEYIKVYINNIEQADADIDSINISKNLNINHTATFDLGRAYDSSKPTMEYSVEIKYNDWVLFSGYVTQISPTEDPEKMRITAQDEYWKQNKTNKYYQVGHKPQDNQELYYDTIKIALSTEHSWNLSIGDFVPQTIDNFAKGSSDAITNLIETAGNYGWFYDVDGTKKLWTAGEGSIINIKRQELDTNIGLYDLINHSFSEDVEGIVNKLRVQMGEKVIYSFNETGGSRIYRGYNYSNFQGFLTPAWSAGYEVLSRNSGNGYGFDYPDPNNPEPYKDVFRKYNIPYLDPKLSSWSDRYPPAIKVYSPGLIYGSPIGTITDGFTIDFESRTITFTEPIFMYRLDSRGEPTSIRTPTLKLFLWRKNYYTYTVSPSENPEEDVSNPLMFFTDKMGDYPETIIEDLNLTNLSIQEGGTRILPDGTEELIPSWDDTEFAEDYANWQLSKTCDKKIRGTIELTLDTVVFYGIDLSKRIYINGITESPMNILSMDYDLSNFTVRLALENSRYYKRTVSLQSHGE